MITDDQLAEWKAAAEKAPEAPWRWISMSALAVDKGKRPIVLASARTRGDDGLLTDLTADMPLAQFITISRTAVPELIHEVENLRKVAEAAETLQKTLSKVRHGTFGKFEWPEWHVLRCRLEDWRGDRES